MSVNIPTALQAFVNDEIASGAFVNEAELVSAALATFQEMKRRHHALKENIAQSLSQREQGLATSVDFDAIKSQIQNDAQNNAK